MNEWYHARGGKQNGPISREALAELARSGGLDPVKDLVWTSSMKDWQPAGQVPGIFTSAATPSDPTNPYAAPASDPEIHSPADGPISEIVPGSQPIPPTACIKRAFDLVIRHFGMILLIGVVYIASTAIVSTLLTQMDSALGLPPAERAVQRWDTADGVSRSENYFGSEDDPASHLHTLLSNLFGIFLSLGLTRIGLNIVSGKPFTLAMLFGGGRQLVTACLATLLYLAMVIVGLVLFIVPGIYLALRFGHYQSAIVDKNLSVLESLKYSSAITTNNRLHLCGLFVLTVGILLAGLLALLVGLVIAIPIFWLTWVVAYRWMQYGYVAVLDQPGTQTPVLAANP
jgi:hypothetical protein